MSDGSKIFCDTANKDENAEFIETGTVRSLLVPRKNKIEQLDQEIYSEPETTDYYELGIGENFIISSDSEESQFLNAPKNDQNKKNKSNPFIFNIKF